jgi:DnaJ-class molecular chaperone
MTILTKIRRVMGFQTCPICSGTGTDPNTSEKCDNCGGRGRVD